MDACAAFLWYDEEQIGDCFDDDPGCGGFDSARSRSTGAQAQSRASSWREVETAAIKAALSCLRYDYFIRMPGALGR